MKVVVNASRIIRKWPHIEKYQNTTLRYTPNTDFPKVMEEVIGRPQIIRLFITLDEVWDYRSDTYDWNYEIGVHKYENDPNHYHYDWPLTKPSIFHVRAEDYLMSHASCADEVLLNIRRYEREVTDGIVSIDKYEEVLEKVIHHYKQLCPNIRYIECSNEVEIPNFGNLTMRQYYPLYQRCYRVVQRLNTKEKYEIPLLVGGFGMSAGISNWSYWEEFLELLSNDKECVIDFYSMHEYHTNPSRILEFYVRHHAKLEELHLPTLPLMMSEYGLRVGIGDAGRPHNLQNASGEIAGMLLGSYCSELKMFPWCTFHNPNQQLGRTMFILNDANEYVPTPSGHTMTMFSMLGTDELLIEDYTNNHAVATIDDQQLCVLVANPAMQNPNITLTIEHLKKGKYRVKEYLVDEVHNNVLHDPSLTRLQTTKEWDIDVDEDFTYKIQMQDNAFCLWILKKYE